jgi:hypothetical protein
MGMSSEKGLTISWLQLLLSGTVVGGGLIMTIMTLLVGPVENEQFNARKDREGIKAELRRIDNDNKNESIRLKAQVDTVANSFTKYMIEIQKQMAEMNTKIAVLIERTNKE